MTTTRAVATTSRKTDADGRTEPQKLHAELMSWFRQELQRQAANRHQMGIDEDYYDSIQATEEETREMIDRGQFPVAWNEVKPTLDWLIGTERRARTDYKVIARNDDSKEAGDDARVKTKLLKYLEDVGRVTFERSHAFTKGLKGGVGWLEIGVRADPEQEPVYVRSESWRNILYDSLGERLDLEDSRYVFRFRHVDLDVAQAYFPDKAQALADVATASEEETYSKFYEGRRVTDFGPQGASLPDKYTYFDSSAWLNNPRQRVLMIECWHKKPFRQSTGQGMGTYDRTYMRMRCTIMTLDGIVADEWSPYKHNRFPFVPIWMYRRGKDNAPYGPVRPIRGAQDAVNKAMSKSIWESSANQLIIEKGAVDQKIMTLDELRDEASNPAGVMVLAEGGLTKMKLQSRDDRIQGHMAIIDQGVRSIRTTGGVTTENLGQESSATSGKAIGLKQDQGGIVTSELFDNLMLARQLEGEITISLLEQYYDQPKIFSIAGERGRYEYERVNIRNEQTGEVINDVTARATEFVIGEQAWRQTIQQAAFESMMELLGNLANIAPQAVLAMLANVLEMGDFPNKKTMVEQVRKALGQPDPDAPMTPEQQAEQLRKQSEEQRRVVLEMRKLEADLSLLEAKGESVSAEALSKRVRAMYEAMQAGQVVASVPNVAPVADEILRGSGYRDLQGTDPNIPKPQVSVAPAAAQVPPAVAVPSPDLRPSALDGVGRGVETPASDGVRT